MNDPVLSIHLTGATVISEEVGRKLESVELADLGVIPLVAIPVCFGYCVARYQVLQIDFLVKRSLLYSVLSPWLVSSFQTFGAVASVFTALVWLRTVFLAMTYGAAMTRYRDMASAASILGEAEPDVAATEYLLAEESAEHLLSLGHHLVQVEHLGLEDLPPAEGQELAYEVAGAVTGAAAARDSSASRFMVSTPPHR